MTLSEYIHSQTTVTDFARKLGRSRAQVHRYILGKNLSKSIIEEICAATDGAVQPADFFAAPAEKASAA